MNNISSNISRYFDTHSTIQPNPYKIGTGDKVRYTQEAKKSLHVDRRKVYTVISKNGYNVCEIERNHFVSTYWLQRA